MVWVTVYNLHPKSATVYMPEKDEKTGVVHDYPHLEFIARDYSSITFLCDNYDQMLSVLEDAVRQVRMALSQKEAWAKEAEKK